MTATAPALTATEALLSQAAATTPAEVHAARLALIACARSAIRDMDTTTLVAGDGRAGNTLLGGPRRGPWTPRSSCAIRSSTLLRRQADPDEQRPIGGAPW